MNPNNPFTQYMLQQQLGGPEPPALNTDAERNQFYQRMNDIIQARLLQQEMQRQRQYQLMQNQFALYGGGTPLIYHAQPGGNYPVRANPQPLQRMYGGTTLW